MVLTTQLGRRDTLPVQGRIPWWLLPIGALRFTGAKVSVMVLQGCKSTPQKSGPIESGHGRHTVWVAIECSYKLRQKKEF